MLERGRLLVIDYGSTTPQLAARPITEWLRTYRAHDRGGPPLAAPGSQDITCEVAVDQLAAVEPPAVEATQAEWLRRHGIDELVDEGRRIWADGAHAPDLAAIRDRAPRRAYRVVYGIFALGWRGSGQHWRHYRVVYGLLAGLATPLVLSVHSVVSSDFAITLVPGWHSTIFPPYFVAGAIFSGFAMVLTLMIPIRSVFALKDVITERHLEAVAKLTLVTGWLVAYSYVVENFLAWYSGDEYERAVFLHDRLTGPYAWAVWTIYAVNFLVPATFLVKRWRRSTAWLDFRAHCTTDLKNLRKPR